MEIGNASGLQEGYAQWCADVNQYTQAKQNIQFKQEPYHKVTNAHVKAQEVQYNPITQTFTDPQRESKVRNVEQQNALETLA